MKKKAFPIQPIRTEADYQLALQLVAPYFDDEPELDSDAGAHFEAMLTLIEAYETKRYHIAPTDPVQAIKFRMEQQGLTPADLVPMIGQRNRVYEVLNGKRKLTLAMVWKLHTGLGIPAESLIRQPG